MNYFYHVVVVESTKINKAPGNDVLSRAFFQGISGC